MFDSRRVHVFFHKNRQNLTNGWVVKSGRFFRSSPKWRLSDPKRTKCIIGLPFGKISSHVYKYSNIYTWINLDIHFSKPSYKWINPTYPIYNWGYNPLTKWDEPPNIQVYPSLYCFEQKPGFRSPKNKHFGIWINFLLKLPGTKDIQRRVTLGSGKLT